MLRQLYIYIPLSSFDSSSIHIYQSFPLIGYLDVSAITQQAMRRLLYDRSCWGCCSLQGKVGCWCCRMMHQALLSFITIPFVLFHIQRIVVVLLLSSDAPGAAPPHTHIISPLLVSHHHPIRPLLFVSTAAREWSSLSVTVRGSADTWPVLEVCNYVLCRRMRDRAENPTVGVGVGVGVVHQALAAPHSTRGFLRFTVRLTE